MILSHSKIISFLLLLVIVGANSLKFAKTYDCTGNETFCTIQDLQLTKKHFRFDINARNETAIENLYIYGNVPVLSSENIGKICEKFPNLIEIIFHNCQIEEIRENTFEKCTQLQTLLLDGNNFVHLDKNSFKGLRELRKLLLSGGNIPNVDLDISDLKHLESLMLTQLDISWFSPEILREQKNLTKVSFRANDFFDLEVEKIVEYTPNLMFFFLNENKFKCSRLSKILEFLKEKNVSVQHPFKKRVKTPDHVDQIECLDDELWVSEVTAEKEQLELELEKVKKLLNE